MRTILDTIEGCLKSMDVRFGQKLGQIREQIGNFLIFNDHSQQGIQNSK